MKREGIVTLAYNDISYIYISYYFQAYLIYYIKNNIICIISIKKLFCNILSVKKCGKYLEEKCCFNCINILESGVES